MVSAEVAPGLAPGADEAVEEKRQRRRRLEARTAARPDFWPDLTSTLMMLCSAFIVVVTVIPPLRRYFRDPDDPISLVSFMVVPNLVYGAMLFILAIGLRRRLTEAWWVLFVWICGIPQLARIWGLTHGGRDPLFGGEESTPTQRILMIVGLVAVTLFMVWLIRGKKQFNGYNAPGAGLRALAVLAIGTGLSIAIGTLLLVQSGVAQTAREAAEYVVDVAAPYLGITRRLPLEDAPNLGLRLLIDLMGALTVILAAVVLFRSPKHTRYLDAADEARVRAMLHEYGSEDSLGYFASRRDKSVIWDNEDPHKARAGVSYRVQNGVSLASGNPLGDPSRWGNAIAAWEKQARHNGWSLAVMGAGETGAEAYERIGLSAYEIGDEAIVDLAGFSLSAAGMKDVRQAVSRIERRGYTTRVRRHELLKPEDFAVLAETAAAWRGDGGDERGFSMALGRLGDPLDGDCVLVEVMDETGALRGFLSFVPWGRNGLSLDLMRRDPSADNGLVEYMVVGLADASGKLGVTRVSLNFAMFREAFERGESIGAGPLARIWRRVLLLASRNWQLESLYRSNAKYLPDWQPRYLCFEYVSDMPRVGIATGNAEGFLTAPSLNLLLKRGEAKEAGALDRASDRYADEVRALMPSRPDPLAAALATDHLPEQMRVRREKLDRIRESGVEPYPVNYPRTATFAEVREEAGDLAPDTHTGRSVAVAGRVVLKRDSGKLSFATLRDGSGDMQVMIAVDRVGPDVLAHWTRDIDLGDHVGVTGEVITSRRGELSVLADSFALTSKSLRPLPDKHKGLTDPESRARMRYVDLIVRSEAREVAYLRSAVVHSVRESLHRRGFIEVETPMLQLIHGGANARPFETHINAYSLDVYLRIATELHLKRLLVGGIEKVFEIGRQFRNEGADSTHNPEFTSLEMYQTYADYQDMRVLTQEIIQEAATTVFGSPIARRMQPDGSIEEYDLSGEWEHKTILTAVSEAVGEELTPDTPIDIWNKHIERLDLEYDRNNGWGAALEALYEELCEDKTTTPVFYMDFPKETAPLTRTHRDDPRLAEKWDLVAWAAEQATAYSELIDPVDQRSRLVAQSLLAAAGNPEAMQVDEDFLRALEYGMPPTGGQGMGMDRLIMTLTGLNIRETILFPMVKPE